MGFSIDTMAEGRIAVARSSGRISPAERRQHRALTIDFCRRSGIRDVIVDTRGQICPSCAGELFDFGADSVEAIRGLRVAFVPDSDDEDIRLIDNVAANRGACTKTFADLRAARMWLEERETLSDSQAR